MILQKYRTLTINVEIQRRMSEVFRRWCQTSVSWDELEHINIDSLLIKRIFTFSLQKNTVILEMNLRFYWKHPFLRSPELQKMSLQNVCRHRWRENYIFATNVSTRHKWEREGYFSNSKINLLFGRKKQLWNHLGQEHGANSISPIIVWIANTACFR